MTQTTSRPSDVAAAKAHLRGAWRPRPTLDGTDYTSETVYAEERERVWWRRLGVRRASRRGAEPGDYLVRDIAGESIFIARNRDGELRAFYNVCAHRGTKLLDDEPACGHVSKVFKCPYHAWSYDLDGRLRRDPERRRGRGLRPGRVPAPRRRGRTTYAGFLFVQPGRRRRGRSRSTSTTATETHHRLRALSARRARASACALVYEVAANWKIVVENYNECLHCPTIHPELVQVVPLYRFGEVWDEETRDDGNLMIDGRDVASRRPGSRRPPEAARPPARRLRHVLRRRSSSRT